MIEMLEEIVSVPIFIQLSTFALKLAMVLFCIEIVRIDLKICHCCPLKSFVACKTLNFDFFPFFCDFFFFHFSL